MLPVCFRQIGFWTIQVGTGASAGFPCLENLFNTDVPKRRRFQDRRRHCGSLPPFTFLEISRSLCSEYNLALSTSLCPSRTLLGHIHARIYLENKPASNLNTLHVEASTSSRRQSLKSPGILAPSICPFSWRSCRLRLQTCPS